MSIKKKFTAAVAVGLFAVSGEIAFFIGSRFAVAVAPQGTCALLVLGYPSKRDGTLSAEQRDRVATAVEVAAAYRCDPVVISGGAAHNAYSEAATMALEAVRRGLPRTRIRLEDRATTTAENARFSAPKLKDADTIYVVSNGLHAHRGVRALCAEAPDLCAKARPAARYYPLRRFFLKFPAALYELAAWLRDRTANPRRRETSGKFFDRLPVIPKIVRLRRGERNRFFRRRVGESDAIGVQEHARRRRQL